MKEDRIQINFRLTSKQRDQLTKNAEEMNMKLSEYILFKTVTEPEMKKKGLM